MIVLFWNIRGIGNDPTRDMLCELCRMHNPDIIAIAEPKILSADLRPRFWKSINMLFLVENCRGNGLLPNLWVACKRSVAPAPVVFLLTEQLIIIKVEAVQGDQYYGFIHAANSYVERHLLWSCLLPLATLNICLMGDFNAIVRVHEQIGQKSIQQLSC